MSDVIVDIASTSKKIRDDLAKINDEFDKLEKNAVDVDKSFKKTDKSVDGFAAALKSARVAVSAFLAAAAVKRVGEWAIEIARVGSELDLMEVRLKNVTGSTNAFSDAVKIAVENGIGINEVADVMTRLGLAAGPLGVTADELTAFTDTVIKLGRIGGASVGDITGSTVQLGQALASGRLQGDELRSILERMPIFAQRLAQELGVSIGQLRKLGSEGELTSERVFEAILGITEEINDEAASLPVTFEQAVTSLQTNWDLFLKAINTAIGLSEKLAGIISSIGDGIASVTRGINSLIGAASIADKIIAAEKELSDLENSRLSGRNKTGAGIQRRNEEIALAKQQLAILKAAASVAENRDKREAENKKISTALEKANETQTEITNGLLSKRERALENLAATQRRLTDASEGPSAS